MNKSALVAVGVFAALLAAVFFLNREDSDSDTASSTWTIEGFVAGEQNAVKSSSELVDDEFTKIEIRRKGETMVFEQKGTEWRMTAPREGLAEGNRIRTILIPHQKTLTSIFATEADAEAAGDYGLGGDDAIGVTIYRNGAVFASYEVGDAARSDDPEAGPDEVDTWVRQPGSSTVFRMAGADLRKAVDFAANDFRDKKLFGFERHDLAEVRIENPGAAQSPIVLRNSAPAPADGDEGEDGESDKPPAAKDAEGDWSIVQPEGYRAGSGVTGFLASLASTRASKFLSDSEAAEVDTGLDGPDVVRLTMTPRDGEAVTLEIGKIEEQKAYARLAGSKEVIELNAYTAKSLVKTIDDLRDKQVLELTADQITGLRFSAFELRKVDGTWTVLRPAGLPTGKKVVDGLLRDVENFTISEFVSDANLSDLGLDPASNPERVVIENTKSANGELVLEISAEKDGFFYFRPVAPDTGEIWKVSSYMGKKLAGKSADDVRNRDVFDFERADMSKVELVHADETVVLTLQDEGKWKVSKPTESGDRVNASPKDTSVNTLLSTLASLAVKDFQLDKSLPAVGLGAGAFRAVVTTKDGASHELIISDQTAAEDAPYATAPTEPDFKGIAFTVNPYQAKNIRKKFADFE